MIVAVLLHLGASSLIIVRLRLGMMGGALMARLVMLRMRLMCLLLRHRMVWVGVVSVDHRLDRGSLLRIPRWRRRRRCVRIRRWRWRRGYAVIRCHDAGGVASM